MNNFEAVVNEYTNNKKTGNRVLCVWPKYYSKYPPLGLLKIAAYHQIRGDIVELVRYPELPTCKPDIIYVTTLFTYSWKQVNQAVTFYRKQYKNVPIIMGGIYASLMEEHAREVNNPDYIWKGIIPEIENIMPEYSYVPNWKYSLIFSSRGCIRKCPFCAVWKLEPSYKYTKSIKDLIYPMHKGIVIWDNNFLASPNSNEILKELSEIKNKKDILYEVDFNQGLDARLITDENAIKLASLKINVIRLAYDNSEQEKGIINAIKVLNDAKFRIRNILVYAMYNYKDSPDDFLSRVQLLLELGVAVYPMRYQPTDALEKDKYIDSSWTKENLELIADARRVIGVNGAFIPYEGMKKKVLSAKSLEEALCLRPIRKNNTHSIERTSNPHSGN